jgi:hypothetical protein
MHEIGVTLVRHGHVAAIRPVLMDMTLVTNVLGLRALVHVVAVRVMNMTVVHVIGVIAVRERDMAAALAVVVLMTRMGSVLNGIRHSVVPPAPELTFTYKYFYISQSMHAMVSPAVGWRSDQPRGTPSPQPDEGS